MFGALNRFISRLDSDGPSPNSGTNYNAFGFQVLRNKNADIPIEPWYDFIIGINGRPIDSPDPTLFATEIRNCAGSNVALTLWSAKVLSPSGSLSDLKFHTDSCVHVKGQRTRSVHIPVPPPNESPTLGLTLQWTPLISSENVWHILDVTPHSPADNAGLLPYGDYIVGSPEGSVHGEAGLGELVEDYLSRSLRLWVYNHEYAVTRLVTITPSRSWGGEGALGCVLGFGALHRLPAPLTEPPEGPGETMFETAARFSNDESRRPSSGLGMLGLPPNLQSNPPSYQTTPQLPSEGFLVPANLKNAPPPMAPPKGTRKPRKGVSPGRGFDDVFKEGEEKSREEDRPSGGTGNKPPPPPPGAPPKATAGTPQIDENIGEPGEEEVQEEDKEG